MKATQALFLGGVLAAITFLPSCQKEVDFQNRNPQPNGQDIIGDYSFVNIDIYTRATIDVTDGGDAIRAITVTDYTTENNTGTAKITATSMTTSNVSYSANTTMNSKTYINGILFDESDDPFAYTQPTYGATNTYTRNSADSITFAGPVGGGTGPVPINEMGAKLSWKGDTLLIKMVLNYTRPYDDLGVPGTLTGYSTQLIRLKKL